MIDKRWETCEELAAFVATDLSFGKAMRGVRILFSWLRTWCKSGCSVALDEMRAFLFPRTFRHFPSALFAIDMDVVFECGMFFPADAMCIFFYNGPDASFCWSNWTSHSWVGFGWRPGSSSSQATRLYRIAYGVNVSKHKYLHLTSFLVGQQWQKLQIEANQKSPSSWTSQPTGFDESSIHNCLLDPG